MRYLDDEPGGKRLPTELRHGRNTAHKTVLISGEACIVSKAEDCAISKHTLVENLEEVDPDQNWQDDTIDLPAYTFALIAWISWCSVKAKVPKDKPPLQ